MLQDSSVNKTPLPSPWWTLVLPPATLCVMLLSPPERHMWAAALASLVFAGMQWMLPRCRFRTDHYLGPVNIALTLLLLKLFVVPSLIMLFGAESRVLAYLPSIASMQSVVLVDTAAYVALCVGLTHGPADHGRSIIFPLALGSSGPGRRMVFVYFVLGIVGFIAAFGSPTRLISYFVGLHGELPNEVDGSLVALAGTFLRPFFAFALVAWWAKTVDAAAGGKGSLWAPTLAGLVAAVGVTIANLTFSFNRAAFVFPLASLLAVYSARVRRVPLWLTLVLVVVALPLLMALGTLRSSRMSGGDPHSAETPFATVLKDASETVQAYSGGPQFSALFCERMGWGDRLYGGSTLIASALSPVPLLGKSFREGSGPALFNQALYDVRDIEDQILPFATELFANFHLPGVIAGFIALGFVLTSAQQWFESAGSAFAAFSIQYVFTWCAMLAAWSLSIYSQILIYFFGPIYLYVALVYLGAFVRRAIRGPEVAGPVGEVLA